MFKELVRQARTHRRFDQSRPVSETELRELVDISRIAPCGGNLQPLRYRLVSRPEECAAIFPFIAWAAALRPWPGPAEGERPTGYIAILSQSETKTDSGIAAVTLQYAATDFGFRACILGAIKRPEIKKTLNIPEPYEIQLLVAIGQPGEKVVIDDAHSGDPLKYYRDANSVHHVPKLSLNDVILS